MHERRNINQFYRADESPNFRKNKFDSAFSPDRRAKQNQSVVAPDLNNRKGSFVAENKDIIHMQSPRLSR